MRPYRILCIFHTERTASLRILPSWRYKCYGCGRRGHVLDPDLDDSDLRADWRRRRFAELETAGQLRLPLVSWV